MKNKIAQKILQKAGLYNGVIDGQFGVKSQIAANKYYNFPDNWRGDRLVCGVIQVACVKSGIPVGEVDGLWGNNTESGYQKLLTTLDENITPIASPTIVDVKRVYNNWPKQNYDSMVKYFGPVGKNQTTLVLPYPMVLAWDTTQTIAKITCHEKVRDSLERIFTNILNHYGMESVRELRLDRFGGCLNVRKMRGGNAWSIHSWGAALDIDPDRNQLKWGRDKAFLARPEFEPFWKIVEAEGWTSLGRARNYDFMHIQAANL